MNSKDKKMLVFGIYLILILCMFCFHENWRDEVQAYLLCRDMNFLELLKNIHYEGHPFFYYIILYPFVKMGFSLKIVNIISLIFITLSAYLIIYKTKLKDIYKISIVFSYPFLYEYSIVGRSYALIVLLITLLAILWEHKKDNAILIGLLIGLLINTHIFMGGFCLLLFIVFYIYQLLFNRKNNTKKENINILIGFIIICIFGILLILQFLPVVFHGISMSTNTNFGLSNIFRNFFIMFGCFRLNKYFIFMLIFLLCMISFVVMIYKENKRLLILLLLSQLLFTCISSYVFEALLSHNALLTILFVYFICIINYGKKSNFILLVFFIFFIPNVLISCFDEITLSYSAAESAYNYMKKNISKDSIITTVYDAHVSTIMGYSKDYKFYDYKANRYYTYVVWDEKRENKKFNYEYIDKELNNNKDIYYIGILNNIYEYDKKIKKHYKLEKIYKTEEETIYNENYVIYKIKSIKEN